VRVNTDLVQTDVMVFDRHGHFVEGVQPDQFKLTLDGVRIGRSLLAEKTTGRSNETMSSTISSCGRRRSHSAVAIPESLARFRTTSLNP
jgi:hypothetical protein